MDNERKILALINPISGTLNKDSLPKSIDKIIDSEKFEIEIKYTEHANHAYELSKEAAANGYYGVLAIGGDGTVNEVASALCDTETALGIIPLGSGNGLARHLRIPLNIDKAISIINENHIENFDYCTANDRKFFCTCGLGFDAQVSSTFAKRGKRGPVGYFQSAISEYIKYRSQTYKITSSNGIITEKAFIIACGNASQYGNNAYITPNADMQDGEIDVTVMLPITPFDTVMLGLLLFSKHIDQDVNIISFRTADLSIERESEGIMHLDGEPVNMPKTIEIKCHKGGLKIFVPTESKEKFKFLSTVESDFWNFINSIRSELNI